MTLHQARLGFSRSKAWASSASPISVPNPMDHMAGCRPHPISMLPSPCRIMKPSPMTSPRFLLFRGEMKDIAALVILPADTARHEGSNLRFVPQPHGNVALIVRLRHETREIRNVGELHLAQQEPRGGHWGEHGKRRHPHLIAQARSLRHSYFRIVCRNFAMMARMRLRRARQFRHCQAPAHDLELF